MVAGRLCDRTRQLPEAMNIFLQFFRALRLLRQPLRNWTQAFALGLLCIWTASCIAQPIVAQKLRIVGGLAGLKQFVDYEEPFWTRTLTERSGGRFSADIVPFDRAGVPAQDMLRLMQIGVIPFGTAQVSRAAVQDAVFGAVDLAGLNPDMASLRKSVAAFRPFLENTLRQRYGVELLSIYVYPAQMIFCAKPFQSLSDLKGRRIRVSGSSAADFIDAIGGIPVVTSMVEVLPNIGSGNVACAITGSMTGNTLGLDKVTTHLYAMPVTWGVSLFGANANSWAALDPALRVLLREELPKLEARIWSANASETADGIACNIGSGACQGGRKGKMTLVPVAQKDEELRAHILLSNTLPRWLRRCGPACADIWNQTLGPVYNIAVPATPVAPTTP
jgi:TRAP-type C4-dicarboxylate transport system substrate-binding protein